VNGLAGIAGPTLGGAIVTYLGWRWIFYVNIPVGVIAFTLALLLVPDLRPGRRHQLDVVGVLLATAGLFAIVFGLIEGQRYSWGAVWSFVTIPGIIGLGSCCCWSSSSTSTLAEIASRWCPCPSSATATTPSCAWSGAGSSWP